MSARYSGWTGKAALLAFAMLLFIVLLLDFGIGAISSHRINAGLVDVTSDQQLICYWTLSTTTSANVTWYRNGVANVTQSGISCTAGFQCSTSGDGNVPDASTLRGDGWVCSVSYYNGSALENDNVSVNIINSPPTPPKVYLPNGTETTNLTTFIVEDNTTILSVNSTDADGDSITYTLNDTTFCSINATSGRLTCSPSLESHVGLRSLHLGAMDSNSAQFIDLLMNVTPNNDPPSLSPAIQNKTVYEGQALNYTLYGIDAEGYVPYTFTMSSDLGSALVIESLNTTSAVIRFNHSNQDIAQFGDRGNHTVTVNITDAGNASLGLSAAASSYSFILQVIPVNHLANISVVVYNASSLTQGGNLSIYVNATDVDNDTITFYSSNAAMYNISYGSTDKSNPSGISFVQGWVNVTGLTNDYVVSPNFTISAFDTKENSTWSVALNITNVNDAPLIYAISSYPANTLSNTNISNLSAYTGVPFSYRVNATDVDMQTYEGDVLNYSTNDSRFPIDSSGMISFTYNTSGNFTFLVNVTDNHSSSATKVASLQVFPNQNPRFTQSPITISCYEYDSSNHPYNCSYNMSANATDDDAGDYVASFWTNSTLFSINQTTGMINFTATQALIGTYIIRVNITDSRGGTNSTTATLTINNTNNPPTLSTITFPSSRVSVGDSASITVVAADNDLSLASSYENLTFNTSVTGPTPSIFSISKTSAVDASIAVSPTLSADAGNYSINISVRDYYGNISSSLVWLYIYNVTSSPNITAISPFGTPIVSGGVNRSMINTSNMTGMSTSITITENESYIFNETTIADNASYPNLLSYEWYYDGTVESTSQSFNKSFDFFSSGMHNMTFKATDEFNKSSIFYWNITVTNLNRPPRLVNSLDNLSVNGTQTVTNYLTYSSGTKFYDPDDDPNSTGIVVGDSPTLTFAATTCSYANFSFSHSSLYIKTISVGACYVNFTAYDGTDPSLFATSNQVLINITQVSNETTVVETPVSTPSSGGGGGSSTRTVTIPLPEEVEKPKPLQILTPKLVTIYQNATVKVPIVVNNTWNDTLEGVRLGAYTNATNVTLYIDTAYFPRLEIGESREVTLIIGNYKSEGHYEIQLMANVTNPSYSDVATIFVNAADMQSEGEALENKISFARDLLSSNPDCQELTELLNQAKTELSKNNLDGTAKLVDDVINGCRYLITNSKSNVEKPTKNFIQTFEWDRKYNSYLIVGLFTILFMVVLIYLFKKDDSHNDF